MAMRMKDSGIEWIGEIPADWEVRKLKYCCGLVIEKIVSSDDNSEPLPYIGLEHVGQHTGQLESTYELITDFSGDTIRFYTDDVLFGKLRPYLAKIWLAEYNGKCSSEFFVLHPEEKTVPAFLKYGVLSKGFVDYVDGATFGVKMPRADWGFVGNIGFPVTTKNQQQKIAAYLDSRCAEIDAVIAAKQRQNGLLKEQRQSIIFEAVTKGLDPTVTYKDSGVEWIGEIPEGWERSRVKYRARVNGRIGFRGYTVDDLTVNSEEGALVLGGTNIDPNGKLNLSIKTFIINSKYEESPEIKLVGGEIIMTKVGAGLGQTAMIEDSIGRATINPNVMIIFCREIRNKYLHYYFLCAPVLQTIWLEGEKSGAQPAINQSFINNFPIVVPPHAVQKKIADYLDSRCAELDRVVAANNAVIDKLKEYRQSLIYEAVTGKIAV
jgi:type I restriction enzyme S subunit